MFTLIPKSIVRRAAAAITAILIGTALLAQPAAARDQSGHLTFDGKDRTYAVHVPDGPPPPGGFAVILAFHGGGMQGAAMRKLTHFDQVADTRRFIVVYPDGLDKHWNDGRLTIRNPQDDVGFVSALIDRLESDYPVSRGRVYATGISNGALFAERLGCDLAGRIAAIAPVAGTLPADLAPRCRPAAPVAVMQIDGTADPIMPFGGGKVADFGGRGEGGVVLSVAATTDFWAGQDHCAVRGVAEPLPPIAPFDRTRIVATRATDCANSARVTLLTVFGGGHAWPGGMQYAPRLFIGSTSRQMDASQVIADFFLSQPVH
ncbi:alpha/beta hydrolase family esterase [Sphingomonas nostoxanthinifaciens]|uniref:alpha/beta hydrolase family esterase n=1 Tax=Sphingomonas nostoxanthinifaciens TaxID=2872652 RepID=UPI001CC1D372|nr:hypothetical protein [Sphingomonas nostoxanthinifaciens]UAK23718.1 hypothetical protein K8P63_15215 [Sphingomonas nostoxanthinifaciens]